MQLYQITQPHWKHSYKNTIATNKLVKFLESVTLTRATEECNGTRRGTQEDQWPN